MTKIVDYRFSALQKANRWYEKYLFTFMQYISVNYDVYTALAR